MMIVRPHPPVLAGRHHGGDSVSSGSVWSVDLHRESEMNGMKRGSHVVGVTAMVTDIQAGTPEGERRGRGRGRAEDGEKDVVLPVMADTRAGLCVA